MDLTEVKILKLKNLFPEIKDEGVLLEVLVSCGGSVKEAELLLLDQFQDDGSKKRKSDEMRLSKYQSSISSLFEGNKKLKTTEPVRRINKSNTKTVLLHTKEDVEATLPYVTFHRNFLPQEVANNILRHLLANKQHFKPKTFHLFENECVSNHRTGVFSSNDKFLNHEVELVYNAEKMSSIAQYNDDLRILQMLVEDKVESEILERGVTSPFQPKTFNGDFSVCNIFEDRTNNLDWHSDRLSYIGPLPLIASISLGATREFKLRRNHPVKQNPHPIYSIPLPHNTLIIMHSGTQEEYKHCVMLSASPIEKHPISNQVRFNLTLRSYCPRYYNDPPRCKCDVGMILRRSYKTIESRGKYFWQCNNIYKNKSCGDFKWAKFDDNSLYTDDEKLGSVWIAEDDLEKHAYLKQNGFFYDKDKGRINYN